MKNKKEVVLSQAEREERNDKIAHKVYLYVLILLAIMFVVGFTYGINAVLALEGQMAPNVLTESEIPVPQSKEEAYSLFDDALDKALQEKPKLTSDNAFNINEETIVTKKSEYFLETFKFVNDGINEIFKSGFDKVETNFGEELDSKLRIPDFKISDIIDYSVNYVYYRCTSCGNVSSEQLDNCDNCGYSQPYAETWNDEYEIVFTLKDTQNVIQNNFTPKSKDDVLNLLKGNYEETLKFNNIEYSYDTLIFKFKVNRFSNQLTYLEYGKELGINADIEFINEFSSLENEKLKFKANDISAYTLTWPKIILSAGGMSIEPKGTSNLLAKLICDDPTAYTVNWTSADESIVEIDDEGYMKTGKKQGETTVTASFEFNGKVYSADCKVVCKIGVESMKLNKRNVKLDVGKTYQLEAKVSPADATIQTVKWYTEDERIATVDEEGVITAVSSGVVKVYALSDDGYYKSSCEVSVK